MWFNEKTMRKQVDCWLSRNLPKSLEKGGIYAKRCSKCSLSTAVLLSLSYWKVRWKVYKNSSARQQAATQWWGLIHKTKKTRFSYDYSTRSSIQQSNACTATSGACPFCLGQKSFSSSDRCQRIYSSTMARTHSIIGFLTPAASLLEIHHGVQLLSRCSVPVVLGRAIPMDSLFLVLGGFRQAN